MAELNHRSAQLKSKCRCYLRKQGLSERAIEVQGARNTETGMYT